MRQEAGHIQARSVRTQGGSDSEAPGLVRALRAQLAARRGPLEVSLDHEDYRGRNVLSITVRDDDDVDETPVYYEQLVFTRFRRRQPSTEDHAGQP